MWWKLKNWTKKNMYSFLRIFRSLRSLIPTSVIRPIMESSSSWSSTAGLGTLVLEWKRFMCLSRVWPKWLNFSLQTKHFTFTICSAWHAWPFKCFLKIFITKVTLYFKVLFFYTLVVDQTKVWKKFFQTCFTFFA